MMSYTVLFSLLLIYLVGVYGQTANLPISAGNNVAQYDTPINIGGLTPTSMLTVSAVSPAPQIYVCLRQYIQPSNNVANWANECGESFFTLDSTTTTGTISATSATSAASSATSASTAASSAATTATSAASTAATDAATATTATTAATSDATTASAATSTAATDTTAASTAASTATTAASTATTAAATATNAATTSSAASTAATSDATTATSATSAATTAASTAATAVTTATSAATTATNAATTASTAATTATAAASTVTTLTTATSAASTATTAASTATTAAATATTAASTATTAASTATTVATTATTAATTATSVATTSTTDAATTAATAVAAGPTAAATNAASTATSSTAAATTVVRSFSLGGMYKRLQTISLRQSTNNSNDVLLATGNYYLAVGTPSSAQWNGTVMVEVDIPNACAAQTAGPHCEGALSALGNGSNIYPAQPNTTQYLSFNVPTGTLSMMIMINNSQNSTGLWAAAPTMGNVPQSAGTVIGNDNNATMFMVNLPSAGTYYMSLSNMGTVASSPNINFTLNTCPDTPGTSMVGPDCNTTINALSSTNVVTAQLNGSKGWYYFQPTALPLRVSVIGMGIAGKNYSNNFVIYGKQGQVPTTSSWDIVAYANPSNNQYFPTILSTGNNNNTGGNWYFGVTNQNTSDTQFGIWQTSVCPNNCGGGNGTAPCGQTGNDEGICQCGNAPSGTSFAYDCKATKGGKKKGGISTEVIILIVIGVVTVSAIVAGTAFYLYRRSQRQGYTRV